MDLHSTSNISIGDTVLVRLTEYGDFATVESIRKDKNGRDIYHVKYHNPHWSNITHADYLREGITKNYDQNGHEIIGNAQYYCEELTASWWGDEHTPRTVFDFEIYPPTAKRNTWLIDTLFGVEETTLDDICNQLAALYQQKNSEMQTETVEA